MALFGGSLGKLAIRIVAETAQFQKEMDGAAFKAKDSFGKMEASATRAGKIIGLAVSAAATGISVMVKMAVNNADAMGKMAQSAGVGVQAFSELAHVAKLSNVSAEALGTSIGRLSRNMSDAAKGTGEARHAFAALGIDVKRADGTLRSADEIMGEVADQFANMEDGASKSAIAMQLFGRAGLAMIPMLNSGSKGMRDLRREANDLGVTLSQNTSKAAEQFNDNLTKLNAVKAGLVNILMERLLPHMNALTDSMVASAKAANDWRGALSLWIDDAIEKMADLAASVMHVLKAFQSLQAWLAGTERAWAALNKPLDLTDPLSIPQQLRDRFLAFRKEYQKGLDEITEVNERWNARIAKLQESVANTARGVFGATLNEFPLNELKKGLGPQIHDAAAKEKNRLDGMRKIKDATRELRLETEAAARAYVDAEEMASQDALEARMVYYKGINDEQKRLGELFEKGRQQMADADEAIAKFQAGQGMYGDGLEEGAGADPERIPFIRDLRAAMGLQAELLQEAHDARIARIKTMEEGEFTALGGKHTVIESLTEAHQKRLAEIEWRGLSEREKFQRMSYRNQAKTIFGEIAGITAGVAQHNRKLFEINKVAGIANALINMHAGISKSLATYAWPLAGIMAALHAAAGLAQVQAIKSATFEGGGGGSAPSIAGTTPAPAVTPVASSQQPEHTTAVRVLRIEGLDSEALLSGKQVRQLLEQLAESTADGGRIVVG